MIDKKRQDHPFGLRKTKAKLGMGFDTSDTDIALDAALKHLKAKQKMKILTKQQKEVADD